MEYKDCNNNRDGWKNVEEIMPPPDQDDRRIRYDNGEEDIGYWNDPYWRTEKYGRVFPDGRAPKGVQVKFWKDI